MSQDLKGKLKRNPDAAEIYKATEINLLQPETLNYRRLQETLKVYRIPLKGDETRSELLKLFEDHIRPKPQRLSSNRRKTSTSKPAEEQESGTCQCTPSTRHLPSKRTTAGEGETVDVPTSKKPALPDGPLIPRFDAVPGMPEGARLSRQSGGTGGVPVGGNSGGTNLPQKRNAPVKVNVCVCVSCVTVFVDMHAVVWVGAFAWGHIPCAL